MCVKKMIMIRLDDELWTAIWHKNIIHLVAGALLDVHTHTLSTEIFIAEYVGSKYL